MIIKNGVMSIMVVPDTKNIKKHGVSREQVCSQHSHCLSCPLTVGITGKDCRTLTFEEIQLYANYNIKWRDKFEETTN